MSSRNGVNAIEKSKHSREHELALPVSVVLQNDNSYASVSEQIVPIQIIILLIILLIIVIALGGMAPNKKSDKEIEAIFRNRPLFIAEWNRQFPNKEKEIEEFLKIICDNFWLSQTVWEHFSPNDDINIIYSYHYPVATKWWQIEWGGDNLEHYFFIMELENETNKALEISDAEKMMTLGQYFQYFYTNIPQK